MTMCTSRHIEHDMKCDELLTADGRFSVEASCIRLLLLFICFNNRLMICANIYNTVCFDNVFGIESLLLFYTKLFLKSAKMSGTNYDKVLLYRATRRLRVIDVSAAHH